MAKKIDKKATSAPSGADVSVEAAEVEILHPERTLPIGDEKITVREFGFVEGLRLNAYVAPLVAAIGAGLQERGGLADYAIVKSIFASQWESTVVLMAAACDRSPEWVGGLNGNDGNLLLMTFWGVNASFFIGLATNETAIRRETARLLGGENSTPASSPTDTGSKTSSATPSAS